MIGPKVLTQEEFDNLPIEIMRSFHGVVDVKNQHGKYKEIDYRSASQDNIYKYKCGKK